MAKNVDFLSTFRKIYSAKLELRGKQATFHKDINIDFEIAIAIQDGILLITL